MNPTCTQVTKHCFIPTCSNYKNSHFNLAEQNCTILQSILCSFIYLSKSWRITIWRATGTRLHLKIMTRFTSLKRFYHFCFEILRLQLLGSW